MGAHTLLATWENKSSHSRERPNDGVAFTMNSQEEGEIDNEYYDEMVEVGVALIKFLKNKLFPMYLFLFFCVDTCFNVKDLKKNEKKSSGTCLYWLFNPKNC